MKQISIIFLAAYLLTSCNFFSNEDKNLVQEVGMKPIYFQGNDWRTISVEADRPFQNLGKIYYKDSLIYVSELGKGIHIVDNSNPANPQRLKFIAVPGAKDIAIKGATLYADNFTDLVAIDISDFNNIHLVKRVENLYPSSMSYFPESYTGYFECVDTTKGIVIGWEEANLVNPKCRR